MFYFLTVCKSYFFLYFSLIILVYLLFWSYFTLAFLLSRFYFILVKIISRQQKSLLARKEFKIESRLLPEFSACAPLFFLWLSLGSNQYRAERVYDLCVYFMAGTPEGSIESGSGEAGNQTSDPWFTRHSTYPLHHGGFLFNLCFGMSYTSIVLFQTKWSFVSRICKQKHVPRDLLSQMEITDANPLKAVLYKQIQAGWVISGVHSERYPSAGMTPLVSVYEKE